MHEGTFKKWNSHFVSLLEINVCYSPNVYRTPGESLQAFQWFSQIGEWDKHFSAWERWVVVYIGAAVMWIVGKRLQKRHGLKQDVRQSFYDETNNWLKAVKQKGGKTFDRVKLVIDVIPTWFRISKIKCFLHSSYLWAKILFPLDSLESANKVDGERDVNVSLHIWLSA